MAIARPITSTIISTVGWGIPVTDELNRLTGLADAGRTWTFSFSAVNAGGTFVKIPGSESLPPVISPSRQYLIFLILTAAGAETSHVFSLQWVVNGAVLSWQSPWNPGANAATAFFVGNPVSSLTTSEFRLQSLNLAGGTYTWLDGGPI